MKLIAAHIAGFGRLTDFTLNYERGITALCMENGWGKTTLAYFHKAMFYGLDSSKPKGDLKERERFRPWIFAPFGGWLEFAIEGPDGERAYRIERTFGDRPAKDRFTLYSLPDLRPSADFADPVGMSLFGLNAGSFIRTLFCTGIPHTPPQTPDSALLAERFGENPVNGRILDRAVERLEDRRVELQTKRGDNGKIPELRRKLYALDQEISDCRNAAAQAKAQREELDEIADRIGQDRERIVQIRRETDECARIQARLARLEQYRGKMSRLDGLQKEIAAEADFFRDGDPSEESMTLLQKAADDCRLAEQYERQVCAPFDRESEYSALSRRFPDGPPDGQAMRDCREIDEKRSLGMRRAQEIRESEEFVRLSARFADHIPDERTVDQMLLLAREPMKGRGKSPRTLPLLAGMVLIGLAILGWILTDGLLPAILLLLPALAGAGLALYAFLPLKKGEEPSPLRDFLTEYGIEGDPLTELQKLRLDGSLYCSRLDDLSALDEENRSLSERLDSFLGRYHAPDRATLEGWARDYSELDKARRAHESQAAEAKERAIACREKLSGMLARYPVDASDPDRAVALIRGHRSRWELLEKDLADARREEKEFIDRNPDLREAAESPADGPEIESRLAALRTSESELSALLEGDRDAYRRAETELAKSVELADRLPTLLEERQRTLERSEQAAASLEALVRAQELLAQAGRNLSDRYLSGVQEKFSGYLQRMTDDMAEAARYRTDGNLSVLAEEAGAKRESGRLSSGRQDMAALCVRLALADVLMDGKADFLILDDPFVCLDDGRIESALSLLRDLAKDRQILYLTCSRARMPRE